MKLKLPTLSLAAALCAVLGAASPGHAAVITLTFEGLKDREAVAEFYNGGLGGSGSGPGPNFGVSFTPVALATIDSDQGGTGNFGGEPSGNTAAFFLPTSAGILNVPAGFTTGFSFYYSAVFSPGVVKVYDGLNATGNVIATLNLATTPMNGAPDPTGLFSPFIPFGTSFAGTAKSVDFGGVANQIGFDNITLGSATPTGPAVVPLPTVLTSSASLLALLSLRPHRRRR